MLINLNEFQGTTKSSISSICQSSSVLNSFRHFRLSRCKALHDTRTVRARPVYLSLTRALSLAQSPKRRLTWFLWDL